MKYDLGRARQLGLGPLLIRSVTGGPGMRSGNLRVDERTLFAAGVVLCLLALLFGFDRTVYVTAPAGNPVTVPNTVAGAAAGGFAIAGGLCFLAAALAPRKGES